MGGEGVPGAAVPGPVAPGMGAGERGTDIMGFGVATSGRASTAAPVVGPKVPGAARVTGVGARTGWGRGIGAAGCVKVPTCGPCGGMTGRRMSPGGPPVCI